MESSSKSRIDGKKSSKPDMYNLGEDHLGWSPAFCDFKELLNQIKSDDEFITYQAVMELANQLSIAQENTLTNFPIDHYIPALLAILKRPSFTDISTDVKFYTIQSLNNLMDIFPTICNLIVNNSGVKTFAETIESNLEFIDLSEQCIKAIEKISMENPNSVLASNCLTVLLNMMDFFEITTQKKIMHIAINCSRHSTSEADFNQYLIPLMPCFNMLLQTRGTGEHQKEQIENSSTVVLRIFESFYRLFNPITHYAKIEEQVVKMSENGIIDSLLAIIHEASIQVHQTASVQETNKQGVNNQQGQFTKLAIQQALKSLAHACKMSPRVAGMAVDSHIFKLLENFLPEERTEFQSDSPFLQESVQLLDSVFPEKIETQKPEQDQSRVKYEQLKKDLVSKDQSKIAYLAQKILPKIFFIYENNINNTLKIKILQIIDKTISLFNEDLLNNFIEPYAISKFLYSIFQTQHPNSVKICLNIIVKLLQANATNYIIPLMRQGVLDMIKSLSSIEGFEKVLGFKYESKPEPVDQQFSLDSSQIIFDQIEQNMQQKEGTLFGSESLKQEQEKLKELFLSKALGQKYTQMKQRVETELSGDMILQTPLQQQKGVNEQILNLSHTLCAQYIDNADFMNKVKEGSKQDFQMFSQLQAIAEKLSSESQMITFNEGSSHQILNDLAMLLCSSQSILCHEFVQSKILWSLKQYLATAPKQAKHMQQMGKHEETKFSQSQKANEIRLSKKESRTLYLRLKQFAIIMAQKINNKLPLMQLLALLQDELSNNQSSIFKFDLANTTSPAGYSSYYGGGGMASFGYPHSFGTSSQSADLSHTVNALKSLTKRIKINLIYDNKMSMQVNNEVLQQHAQLGNEKQLMSAGDVEMSEPGFTKAKSEQLPFANLGAGGSNKQQQPSKVHAKRNYLFNELKQVLVSVEQCASIWLLEEFLRNRVRTLEDVKALKVPQSHFQKYQSLYNSSNTAKDILQRTKDQMRALFEGKEHSKEQSDQFAKQIGEEIAAAQDLTDEEQFELVRQLEMQTIQFMDEIYEGDESMDDDGAGAPDQVQLERFLNIKIIDQVKTAFKEKKKQLGPSKTKASNLKLGGQGEINLTDHDQIMDEEHLHQLQEENKEIADQDLEDLIKANGEDIDFEFYYKGKIISHSQILYELLYQKSQGQAPQTAEQIEQYIKYGGINPPSDSYNIQFIIKEKLNEQSMMRKDSIVEYYKKPSPSKSESKEEMNNTVSQISFIMQQILNIEFKVFEEEMDILADDELLVLEQTLKLMKIVHFMCRNHALFGASNWLMSENQLTLVQGQQDLDLQIVLAQVQGSQFQNSKIGSYLLKFVQDPSNLISGTVSSEVKDIFNNCPFLFSFETRQLFFKLVSFIGSIDINRSIFFLKQFLKQKGYTIAEDKNAVKIQKQKVTIDRKNVIEGALKACQQINKRAFLEAQFVGEEGTGLGPTLEFYNLLSEQLRGKTKLWRKMPDNTLFPAPFQIMSADNEMLGQMYDMFKLAGTMVAKSIVDDRLIDLPFSALFWDLVLGKKTNIMDLEKISKEIYKTFAELQIIQNKRIEIEKQKTLEAETKARYMQEVKTSYGAKVEDLGFMFTLAGNDEIELRKGGKDMNVTLQNVDEYIDLNMHFLFHETIKIQINAFRKGFNSIFPVDSLKCFTSLELEEMVCGIQNEDDWSNVNRLQTHVIPAHGYNSNSKQYLWFLQIMVDLKPDQRRNFLKFITGSPRLPFGGFQGLDPKMQVVLRKTNAMESPDDFLPSVMTCQNYVKLPSYSNIEIMRERVNVAISDGQNNFTLS